MKTSLFYVGQIVDHLKFGYRGVVFGVDAEFSLSDEWYEQVARSRPPKDEPWYHVLVDQGWSATSVAQRHLSERADLSTVEHPGLDKYFGGVDGARYLPGQPMH